VDRTVIAKWSFLLAGKRYNLTWSGFVVKQLIDTLTSPTPSVQQCRKIFIYRV